MKYLKIRFVSLFFVGLSIGHLSAQKSSSTNNLPALEHSIDSLFSSYKSDAPGLAMTVIRDNQVILKKEYGMANLEYQIPITSQTVFHVASVSKQFTSYAIALLESEGKLSLDDAIQMHIPEMNDVKNVITLRQLFNHTSGLRDQSNLMRLAGWRLDDPISNQQVLDLIYNQNTLNFKPGEQFMYSNSGYSLLAEVVARITGKSFAEFVKDRIFIPLKMSNSQFVDTHGLVIKNKASSYFKQNGAYVKESFQNTSVGSTNLSTTLEDLSKWSLFVSRGLNENDAIFNKMKTPGKLNNGSTVGYGLGWFVNNYMGLSKIEHSGIDASYQSYIGWFPTENTTIILLSNNGNLSGGRTINKLINICFKSTLQDKTNQGTTVKTPIRKKATKVAVNMLQKDEGHYWNFKDNYSRKLIVRNDTLHYVRDNGDATAMIPVGENEYEFLSDEYVSVKVYPLKMTVTLDDGYMMNLEKYVPANYNSENIKEYFGRYYSKELNAYYTFKNEDEILVAQHLRQGDFYLKAIMKDFFIGNKGSFREVKFVRNKDHEITGFKVSSSRAKNVWFDKISD